MVAEQHPGDAPIVIRIAVIRAIGTWADECGLSKTHADPAIDIERHGDIQRKRVSRIQCRGEVENRAPFVRTVDRAVIVYEVIGGPQLCARADIRGKTIEQGSARAAEVVRIDGSLGHNYRGQTCNKTPSDQQIPY